MRKLHSIIKNEFGGKVLPYSGNGNIILRSLPTYRRFTLRCLSQKITPVSLRLKSNIKTERGTKIIQRAEKQLMDERVRLINSTIDIYSNFICTCMNKLKVKISQELHEECHDFINKIGECRHKTIMERQLKKFE